MFQQRDYKIDGVSMLAKPHCTYVVGGVDLNEKRISLG
jgi:hypothetical protein